MIKPHELKALKERFRTLIRDELSLARFKEDKQGDFLFRYERMNLTLIFDETDPSFVWLVMFGIHYVKADEADSIAAVDRCISEVNYRVKAVKASRSHERDKDGEFAVNLSIGFFAEDTASHDSWTLERYMSQIKTGADLFLDLHGRPKAGLESALPASAARH